MENDKTASGRPAMVDAAGWMALPIGIVWSGSFLCTMYGTERPLLSVFGTALGIVSVFMLYRQLSNYRLLRPTESWLHILRLSLLTCLLAGLLTDAVQYLYFVFLDDGRLLSALDTTLRSEEYREALRQIMPEAGTDEIRRMIQSMTVRDIMLQMVMYNVMLALPVSLLVALPVRKPRPKEEK